VRLSDLVYELDPTCIAREPSEVRLGRRGLNRMLCVQRKTASLMDSQVSSLPALLSPGDVVVVNDSCRSAGVLFGRFSSGGEVELRLVKRMSDRRFVARVFPDHFCKPGAELSVEEHTVTVVDGPTGEHGLYTLQSSAPLEVILEASGKPITSFFYDGYFHLGNYNPVYSRSPGSFESPMAGLHLSEEILADLRSNDIEVVKLTHHVVGSWLSPIGEEIDALTMSEEAYEVPVATAKSIRRAKNEGNRVVAVGSTCVRALESASNTDGVPSAGPGRTSLCIRPGFQFRCVDGYLTSFHPARSSLMVLDVAFCGLSLLRSAYMHANRERYMFLEFGDAVVYL